MHNYADICAGIMNMMREKITIGTINERMKNIERVKKKIYERMTHD